MRLDLVQTVAFAGIVLFAGYGLKRLVPLLSPYNIPDPVAGGLPVAQNVAGAATAMLFGQPALMGVLAGSVTLTGGPATGLAFAPLFEQAGVAEAPVLAVAAAMVGIVAGGLLGGPVGTYLLGERMPAPAPADQGDDRAMGRDYDAAVLSTGFLGFMLGTTANAMANLGALVERYGPAPKAYPVVPLVGPSSSTSSTP